MEHNKEEKSLIPSGKTMRAWLDKSPACTKIVDLDFNLRYMSDAGVKGLHIDNATQLYGKPYPFDFYPESFRDVMSKNMEKVVETGVVVTQEASVFDTEGDELWFHSTIIPVNNDEDIIDHLMIVSIDTTIRNKAESELTAVNENLEQRVEDRT
ncbi:MAG: PAS domain-containing protein, partial [Candidatus Scalindua sp.]|nr:PAS domain-containing protein [Candidatus Scalindua sp.]